MHRVMGSIQAVDQLVEGISAASTHQAERVNKINATLHASEDAIQKNAAMVQEAMSALDDICNNTSHLNRLIQRFTLDGGAAEPGDRHPAALRRAMPRVA
jgi:methyl-accepting chemotaxis protein